MSSLKHIAMIMDGNGRWAKLQDKPRIEGHKRGAEVVRDITTYCARNKQIEYLTLYAFSTENWKRPKTEVAFLMKLLEQYLKKELSTYINNDIKLETIGDLSKFSSSLQKIIAKTKEKTKNNSSLTQILALNYGAKDEIVRTVNFLKDNNREINEENITLNLDTQDIPSVDMLIRSGGEKRVSNFMLWQIAYAEFFFTSTLWPDFNELELSQMIEEYQSRDRRFGGI